MVVDSGSQLHQALASDRSLIAKSKDSNRGLVAAMERDTACFNIAKNYESAFFQMAFAMDRRDTEAVFKSKKILDQYSTLMQQWHCQAEVEQLLQRGECHSDLRQSIAERFQREFSLLQPLRGGGGGMSAMCGGGPSAFDDSEVGSHTGPTRPPDSSSSKSRGCWGGLPELEEEEPFHLHDVNGVKDWPKFIRAFLDLAEVGVALLVGNFFAFFVLHDDSWYKLELFGWQPVDAWMRFIEVLTISLLLATDLLDAMMSRNGCGGYLSNGFNLADLILVFVAFLAQVAVPSANEPGPRMLIMGYPVLLRLYKLLKKWRSCCGFGGSEERKGISSAPPPPVGTKDSYGTH